MKPEEQEQVWLLEWAFYHPDIRPYLIYIENEGKCSWARGKIAKRMGKKKGVSDLFLAKASDKYHGFWLELKSMSGKPTSDQLKWIKLMESVDYKAGVYYGWVEAAKAICLYLGKDIKGL